MHKRIFGKTGIQTSEIGFGAWAIGGTWGDVDDAVSKKALSAALDAGMTFIDTADVYGDGRSERLIAEVLKTRQGRPPPAVAVCRGLFGKEPARLDRPQPQKSRHGHARSRAIALPALGFGQEQRRVRRARHVEG
jgi:aryl-alcohol dehydrogenase-like predicted oxidoreductase